MRIVFISYSIKMTFYTMATILVMALIAVNSDDSHSMCGTTKEDTIINGGVVHYEVTTPVFVDGVQVEVTGFILYDVYLQAFIEAGFDVSFDHRSQAGFFIADCDDDPSSDGDEDCQSIRDLRTEFEVEDKEIPFFVKFVFHMDNESTTIIARKYKVSQFGSKYMDLTDGYEIWPDAWADERDDQAIMGAAAYFEKKRMFVYVINGKDDSKNAVVYIRTLKDYREKKDWTVKEVPNTAGKKFISMFYWFLNGTVYASAISSSRVPRSMAEIYEFDPDNPMLFKLKHKSTKDLWMCKYPDQENGEIWTIVLMAVTCLVLILTIGFVFYFVFFLMIRKKDDPIFGLRIK